MRTSPVAVSTATRNAVHVERERARRRRPRCRRRRAVAARLGEQRRRRARRAARRRARRAVRGRIARRSCAGDAGARSLAACAARASSAARAAPCRRRRSPPSRTRRCRSVAASVSDCADAMRSAPVPSAVATIWVCTVVVPLPNSAVPTPQLVARRRVERRRWSRRSARAAAIVAIIATAIPSPTRQSSPVGRVDAVAARERVLGEVEALVEAVAAADEVALRSVVGDHERVAAATTLIAAQLERVDAELERELVHRRLDGEDHLPEPVAAERARRARCSCRRPRRRRACSGSGTGDRLGARRGTSRRGRGCRTRRCR